MAVKSSYMQLLQYVTAALLVVLVSWHLALRLPWLHGVESFVHTLMPEVVYREITSFSLLLLLLAYTALIHGVNGLRIILLEVHHGELWDKAVNAAAVLALLVFGALATYTVVGVEPPA
ncbi:putative succinate dehydrogenase subunit D [Aeropyrum pernix]|uniref:Putative succinate dehydrogenase subunit D n=1 Tax=Aeropyrum pernix TaxID=56636 RepID=A0A401H9A4_AERPX|nr:succinate:quinone oxidoreductase [Aeropyrum pernix]GBF08973.1 putative succinate dehydrogenase subunit D [Aeropyrum pernix]